MNSNQEPKVSAQSQFGRLADRIKTVKHTLNPMLLHLRPPISLVGATKLQSTSVQALALQRSIFPRNVHG